MSPLVAIILLNYNGEEDTIQCLKSLQKIQYDNYCLIVVDNHSEEPSIAALKRAQEKIYFELIESKENRGFSAGNNIGIVRALEKKAEYMLLLNNDTIVCPDFLNKLIQAFGEYPHCGISTGTIYYEYDRNKVWYAGGRFNPKTFKAEMLGYGMKAYDLASDMEEVTFATGCCMCIRAQMLKEIGMLNEKFFLYEEDSEYCFRAQEKGWKIYYVPQAVIYHKVSASTGKGRKASPTTQYYMVRNRYIFIKENAKKCYRKRAYLYSLTMYIYYCMKGYMSIRYVSMGIWDFIKGISGKTTRSL